MKPGHLHHRPDVAPVGCFDLRYPDWDIRLSLLMACSTYLCADWVWSALRHRQYVRWPLAALATWWCVDGSYWLYWSLVDPSVMIARGSGRCRCVCFSLWCGVEYFRGGFMQTDDVITQARLKDLFEYEPSAGPLRITSKVKEQFSF